MITFSKRVDTLLIIMDRQISILWLIRLDYHKAEQTADVNGGADAPCILPLTSAVCSAICIVTV